MIWWGGGFDPLSLQLRAVPAGDAGKRRISTKQVSADLVQTHAKHTDQDGVHNDRHLVAVQAGLGCPHDEIRSIVWPGSQLAAWRLGNAPYITQHTTPLE